MNFKHYPEYKDSGIEWIGCIPIHWNILPSIALVENINEKNTNNEFENYLSLMANIGIIRYEDKGAVGNKKPDDLSKCKIVKKGHLVINSMNFAIGSFGISPYDGICSPVYIVLNAKKNIILENFAFRVFGNSYFQKYLASYGTGILSHRAAIGWDDIKNKKIGIPPIKEQQKIINFLDSETAHIEKLISKQENLIQLLVEQRTSIITNAITKGLDPNSPMKFSGVEWLGEIPEHWGLKRLDSVVKIVRGNSSFSKDDLLENGEYVALQYGKTYKVNEIDKNFNFYVNHEFYKESQVAQNGDVVLVSTSETIEDLGHSCLYARNEIGLIGGEQFLLKPNRESIIGKYLFYATKAFSKSLQIYATGTKVFRFNSQILKTVYIPSISLSEQQKIIDYLDDRCSKIDLLVSKQKKLIEKLKEYRTSIISYAVTGKIDVREAL